MRGEFQSQKEKIEIELLKCRVTAYPMYTKRKILIPLPPSGTLARKKQLLLIRIAIALFIIIFIVVQLNVINFGEFSVKLNLFISDPTSSYAPLNAFAN